ncbi:ABC transporter permease [Pseudorhodoplanes sinuspersici]|uniref:Peptide ABC transporter permease n=1 Tax=Pseudorhodoplanes sinuspersici TaxID=1235591 RepID=A0A1W6ZQF7_9HYPH|nr:ABC transporter permease [Pseudorhodoplanes sinuspersici]ARP99633.1 peptide ABC transporter permease [Pseudorhodoplanes sinuspersici]RKE70607.1 peptide/nickel transport system permease protein [Pseudorhodoplanes sinuspersici]
MIRYVSNRLLLAIPTLIGVAVITFFVLRVLPGDIVEAKLRGDGAQVTLDVIERERVRLGLDKPRSEQFLDWMKGLAQFDLGKSMWTGRPVIEEVAARFEITFQIAIMATLIGCIIAVPLGTLGALYRGAWIDTLVRIFAVAGLAVPSFWLGMLIIMALLMTLGTLPPLSFTPIYKDPAANLWQLIWPALAVGYRFSAVLTRIVRSSLLEVLGEDYIRTARAKGVLESVIVRRHALRNALLPAVTVIGLEFAFLLGGLVVTEQVFGLNGLGKLFVQSVTRHDFTLIQGMVMLFAIFYILTNLVIDLVYAALDPRVRY